jgi:hypothetical protein
LGWLLSKIRIMWPQVLCYGSKFDTLHESWVNNGPGANTNTDGYTGQVGVQVPGGKEQGWETLSCYLEQCITENACTLNFWNFPLDIFELMVTAGSWHHREGEDSVFQSSFISYSGWWDLHFGCSKVQEYSSVGLGKCLESHTHQQNTI